MRTLALLLLTALLGLAQDPPNLSGNWAINLKTSDFAKQTPYSMRYLVDHHGTELEYEIFHGTPADQSMGKLKYVLNGEEGEVTAQGNALKYKAHWQGPVLVVETWGSFGANEIKLVDRWQLQSKGKGLLIERHYEGPGGPQDQKLRFDNVPQK